MMHYEESELPPEIEQTIERLEKRHRQQVVNAFIFGAISALLAIAVISIIILLFQ